MKPITLIILLGLMLDLLQEAKAQYLVFDAQHLHSVIENTAARSGAESTHKNYLDKINDQIDKLNGNVGTVLLAQRTVYNALSNVDGALKNGLAVKNIALIISELQRNIGQAIMLARREPYLLLFAEKMSGVMTQRALALSHEVTRFTLNDGGKVLMDLNARDQLLRKITQHLQVLNGLAYSTWKCMFWAKQRGVIASTMPFSSYISADRAFIAQILQNAKYLRP